VNRRRRRGPVPLVVLASVVLALLLTLRPFPAARAFALWILLLAAIVLAELVRAPRTVDQRRARQAARFEAALRPRRTTTQRPQELERLEREIVLGAGSAAYAYRRLLPRLRAAASARLAIGHGVGFTRRQDDARALLGEHAWELLRPDRPEPKDPNGPGIPRPHIEALVERIESL
jgi:hypothetical protein